MWGRRWTWCAALAIALVISRVASAANDGSLEARAIAALDAAARARSSGDAAAAARAFDAAAEIAEIAPEARALAAQAWLDAGSAGAAERSARAGLEAARRSPFESELHEALGSARAAQADPASARASWRRALELDPAPSRRDDIRLALGASLAESNDLEAAASTLREVWVDAADRPAAARADEALGALERRADRSFRDAAAWRRRGDRLFEARRTEAALAAYEQTLARDPAPADRAHAARRRADCLFRLRRYAEAERAFAALGGAQETRVWHARSLARADRVDEAIAELESVGAEDGATAAWARFLAATLHEGRGRVDRARTLFESAAEGGDPKVRSDAIWRLAWNAWRAGDRDTARRRFQSLASAQSDPIEQLAARYWAARALDATDRPRAHAELGRIAAEYPLSYYGWRAAARVAISPPSPEPIRDGPDALASGDLFLARVLLAAGLRDAAVRALGAPAARARSVGDRIAIATLYRDAAAYHEAQSVVVGAYAERLARGIAPGQTVLWRLAWPDAFPEERRLAMPPAARIDEWFVASILREESGYRPDVVSISGAVGLLQLMPETASRLARDAGIDPFAPAMLVRPAVNLRIGSLYLDRLAARFDGALEPVAASYNAGPEAVASWRRGTLPPADEWVESIPYDETRGYVKRVMRSLHVHRTLYR